MTMLTQHRLLKDYVKTILETDIHSLIVYGRSGLGKTHIVLETIKDLGLREDRNFMYITGIITPVKLYEVLETCRIMEAPKLFIFDDIEGIMANKGSVAILKSSLWEARGKRIVSYLTSRRDDDRKFDFDGKIILITNTLKQNSILGSAIIDRSLYYNIELTPEVICDYLENNLENIYKNIDSEDRIIVWSKVKRFINSPNFSLRTVDRAFKLYKNNKENWYELFYNSMK